MEESHGRVVNGREGILRNRGPGGNPSAMGLMGKIHAIPRLGQQFDNWQKVELCYISGLWRTATGAGREWLRLWATIVALRSSDYCGKSLICHSRTSLISARCKLPRPASTCGVCMRPAWLRKNRKVAASCTAQPNGAAACFARWTCSGRVRLTDNHDEKICVAYALSNNSTFCQLSNCGSG